MNKYSVGFSDGSGTAHGQNARNPFTHITYFCGEIGVEKSALKIPASDHYNINELCGVICDHMNSQHNKGDKV